MNSVWERVTYVAFGIAATTLSVSFLGGTIPTESQPTHRTAQIEFVLGGVGGAIITVNAPDTGKTYLYSVEPPKDQKDGEAPNSDLPKLIATIDLDSAGAERLSGNYKGLGKK